MAKRTPCSEFDAANFRCKSGHVPVSSTCWGACFSVPACMQDDRSEHLIRDDGSPLNWPDSEELSQESRRDG